MTDNAFADRLRSAREMRKLSQEGLAAKLEMQPSQVAHYEAGRRKPSYDNLRQFCEALRVNSDYLLGLSKTPFDALRGGAFVVDPLYQLSQKLSDADRGLAKDFLRLLVERAK